MSKLKELAVAARQYLTKVRPYLSREDQKSIYETANNLEYHLAAIERDLIQHQTPPLTATDCQGCSHLRLLQADISACTHPKVTSQGTRGPIYTDADICYRAQCKGQWKITN